MTYGDRWATTRSDGRALLVQRPSGSWGLWLVQLGDDLVLCDDSMGGHLQKVLPTDDDAAGIRRWTVMQGPQCGLSTRPRNPNYPQRAIPNPRKWSVPIDDPRLTDDNQGTH